MHSLYEHRFGLWRNSAIKSCCANRRKLNLTCFKLHFLPTPISNVCSPAAQFAISPNRLHVCYWMYFSNEIQYEFLLIAVSIVVIWHEQVESFVIFIFNSHFILRKSFWNINCTDDNVCLNVCGSIAFGFHRFSDSSKILKVSSYWAQSSGTVK